jgi:hypothetical protein
MSKEIRAQIDADAVKGLIQIKGGGAIAILALLHRSSTI